MWLLVIFVDVQIRVTLTQTSCVFTFVKDAIAFFALMAFTFTLVNFTVVRNSVFIGTL